MYGYIYKITNLLNKKVYIGQHASSVFDKNYWGGGKYIYLAIKKYGKQNFTREILTWASDLDELNTLEKYWIAKYRRDGFILYNLSDGGEGNPGYKHTAETKLKLSQSHKGLPSANKGNKYSEEMRKQMSIRNKGQIPWNKGIPRTEVEKEKIRKAIRPPVTAQARQKISVANKGRHHWTNGKLNKFCKECPEGFWPGCTRKKRCTIITQGDIYE